MLKRQWQAVPMFKDIGRGIKPSAKRARKDPPYRVGYFAAVIFGLVGSALLSPVRIGTGFYLTTAAILLILSFGLFLSGQRSGALGRVKVAVAMALATPFVAMGILMALGDWLLSQ